MQRLLKILLSLALTLGIVYFFLIDAMIKTALERAGSNALRAQLTIGTVKFHLLPTTLTLRDVQATDASAPLRNLAQADEIAMPLHLSELLDKQLIIEEMQMHGLRFHQPRAYSGAIAEITPAPAVDMTAEQLRAQRHQQWHEALQRFHVALANPVTAADAQAAGSITAVLFGDALRPLLTQLAALLTPPQPSTVADWKIIAKHIDVDGQLDLGKQALPFSGDVENITPQPQQFDAVTRFELNGGGERTGKFVLRGTIDFRKLASASIRLDLSNFPIAELPLSNDAELTATISRAFTDMQGLLSLTGNQFDLNLLMHFREAALQVSAGAEPELQTIAAVLQNTTAFDLNMQARGALDNPALTVNSSLDQPLAAALLQLQQQRQSGLIPSSGY